jgi:hypothetical protein
MQFSSKQLPLTSRQQLIGLESHRHPSLPVNMVTTFFEIRGDVDPEVFAAAFDRVVERHDALRMTLSVSHTASALCLQQGSRCFLEIVDLTRSNAHGTSFDGWLAKRLKRPRSAEEPLFDAVLAKRGERDFVFVVNRHHIVSDNTSSIILHDELEARYIKLSTKKMPRPERSLVSPAPSYSDYLLSAAEAEVTEAARTSETFWANRLASRPPALCFYGGASGVSSILYSRVSCTLDAESSRLIDGFRDSVPPSMVFIVALFAFLNRVTGADDLCLGVPLHNRSRATEGMIGLIMEICPNRVRVAPSDSFENLISKVQQEIADVRPHRKHTVSSRQAGYEVLFNFLHDVPSSFAGYEANYIHASPLTLLNSIDADNQEEAVCPDLEKLILTVQRPRGRNCYELHLDFNRGVISESARCGRVIEHFLAVLALLHRPRERIDSIDILGSDERSGLFRDSSVDPQLAVGSSTVVELFQAQAVASPKSVAVLGAGDRFSYGELDREIRTLAANLRAGGVTAGTLVGICVDRTPRMIVALLAVLHAGGVYVPIDPRHPPERINLILGDTEPTVLLSETALRSKLGEHRQDRVICLDEAPAKHELMHTAEPAGPSPGDRAYIVYTSGSTGRPKGFRSRMRS